MAGDFERSAHDHAREQSADNREEVLSAHKRPAPPWAGRGRKAGVPNRTTRRMRDAVARALELSAPAIARWLQQIGNDDPRAGLQFATALARTVAPRSKVQPIPVEFSAAPKAEAESFATTTHTRAPDLSAAKEPPPREPPPMRLPMPAAGEPGRYTIDTVYNPTER